MNYEICTRCRIEEGLFTWKDRAGVNRGKLCKACKEAFSEWFSGRSWYDHQTWVDAEQWILGTGKVATKLCPSCGTPSFDEFEGMPWCKKCNAAHHYLKPPKKELI